MTTFTAALAAGLLGFGGLASAMAGPAQLMFFLLLLLSGIIVAIDISSDR
ncbi:DUF1328 domain-containing protein [Palleronia pontilimi]